MDFPLRLWIPSLALLFPSLALLFPSLALLFLSRSLLVHLLLRLTARAVVQLVSCAKAVFSATAVLSGGELS
jgi:hypothetical protein